MIRTRKSLENHMLKLKNDLLVDGRPGWSIGRLFHDYVRKADKTTEKRIL